MFVEKDENGKNSLTGLTKMLGSILTIVAFVAGGVLYFETTYMHKAEAEEMRMELEAQTVSTFKQQKELLDLEKKEQKKIFELQKKEQERTSDMRFLEQLQTQLILIQKELERSPADTWLKEKLRRVQDLIKKLEDKLYQ